MPSRAISPGAPWRTRDRQGPWRSRTSSPAATASFNPLLTGAGGWTTGPVHGVWASDPLWTPPADGGAVSSWRNGGSVGGNPVQATGSKQPTYDASNAAYNGAATVAFATDDVLAVNVADIAVPYHVVVVGNVTAGGGADVLVGFGGAANYGIFELTADWYIRDANLDLANGGTPDNNPHLFRGVMAAANGMSLSVDETSVASGGSADGPLSVLSLGAGNAGVGTYNYYLTGDIALALVFNTDPTGQAEWATFKAWVTSTYGITVA